MTTIKYNGIEYKQVNLNDFTFEQFEIAEELMIHLQSIAMEAINSSTDGEAVGIKMFDLVSKAKLERPLLAVIVTGKQIGRAHV